MGGRTSGASRAAVPMKSADSRMRVEVGLLLLALLEARLAAVVMAMAATEPISWPRVAPVETDDSRTHVYIPLWLVLGYDWW